MSSSNDRKIYSRTYDFQLTVNGIDYSNELENVRITSTLSSAWPIISLKLFIDPKKILQDNLHGQDDITLKIRLVGYDEHEIEKTIFKLICLKPDSHVSPTIQMENESQYNRTPMTLLTVPKDSYHTMTANVNSIFGGLDQPMSLKDATQTILTQTGSSAKLVYDSNGENTDKISQVCIYPTTVYNTLLYLDETFGSHSGCPAIYCRYNNELHIINLSDRIKKAPVMVITYMSSDKKENMDIIKKSNDGTYYYSYSPVKSQQKTNTVFAKLGKTIKHVIKPKDKLYDVLQHDVESICKDYGAVSGSSQIFSNNSIDREKYYSDDTGYENSDTFIKSKIAKQVFALSSITLEMEQSLIIKNLLNVGECVKFKTDTVEYMDLSGNYILYFTDIKWNRNGKEWTTICKVKLVRTNKSK